MSKPYITFSNGTIIYDDEIVIKTYEAGEEDLDFDPKRTTRGRLWRKRVMITPIVTLTLKPVPASKMQSIQNAMRAQEFGVTFYYPARGGYAKATMYNAKRRAKLQSNQFRGDIFDEYNIELIGVEGYVMV